MNLHPYSKQIIKHLILLFRSFSFDFKEGGTSHTLTIIKITSLN